LESCLRSQVEPWLPPRSRARKELVHITFRESLVGLCHSLEVPRSPMIAKSRLRHSAEPRSQYIEEAESRLHLTAEQKRRAFPSLSFGPTRKWIPGPTRLYGISPGLWSQYLTRILDHTRCHSRSHMPYRMRRPALLVRGESSPYTTEPRLPSLAKPYFMIISFAKRTSLIVETWFLLIEYIIPNVYLSRDHDAPQLPLPIEPRPSSPTIGALPDQRASAPTTCMRGPLFQS
jgi:hypothetical protein